MSATILKCEMNFLSDLARLCDSWLLAGGFPLSAARGVPRAPSATKNGFFE